MTIEKKVSLKERMDNTIVKINPEMLSNEVLKIDLHQTCDVINQQLICALNSSKVSNGRKSKPWFGSELHQLHTRLKQDYKIGKFENSEPNRKQCVLTKKVFTQICRRKKAEYDRILELKIIKTAESEKNDFWNILKSKRKQPSSCQVDPSVLQNHFTKILSSQDAMMMPVPVPPDHDYLITCAEYDPDLDLPLAIGEKSEAVQNIKKKKAAGLDHLSPAIMNFPFAMISTVIRSIFNKAFSQEECQKSWKVAKLIPFYKGKGNKTDPLLYRGIAVHTAIYKIHANIIHERLRSGYSTITATKELYTYIENATVARPFYVCFIDFEKAFDSINRTLLMKKLNAMGLSVHFQRVLFI